MLMDIQPICCVPACIPSQHVDQYSAYLIPACRPFIAVFYAAVPLYLCMAAREFDRPGPGRQKARGVVMKARGVVTYVGTYVGTHLGDAERAGHVNAGNKHARVSV
jgi:hypothetical protein